MLNGGQKMRLTAMGAIERLKRYTGTNTLALTGKITPHTDDPDGMWLYHLREWMKHRKVQIKLISDDQIVAQTVTQNKRIDWKPSPTSKTIPTFLR